MTVFEIIDRLPYRGPVSRQTWSRRVKQAIIRAGLAPIRATYNQAGDCNICGECGRCPGWHTQEEATK